MNLLQEFKNYLFSQEVKPSKVTVKNYLSDVNNFINWFEQSFNKPFSPTDVTKHVIDNYKIESSEKFSASSTERHLSSLRKFFSFLLAQKITSIDPFKPLVQVEAHDPWHIKDFKNNLFVSNASHLTIKNYLIDIKQFLNWAEEVTGANKAIDSSSNILNYINSDLVDEYKQRLIAQGIFSASTINRKLSSLRKYVLWLQAEGLLGKGSVVSSNIEDKIQAQINLPEPQEKEVKVELKPFIYSSFPPYRLLQKLTKGISLALDATLITQLVNLIEAAEHLTWKTKGQPIFSQAKKIRIPALFTHEDLLGIKNIKKEIYTPLEISTKGFPWYKKTWFSLKYQRPNWYKTYHSYAIVHYFHFAVLVIFVAGLAFGFYNGFVSQGSKNPTLAANVPTNPPRILSFQGRLTDNNDNPVTTGTNLRFAIYNSPTASGGALLWQEVDLVNPDTDGIFNAILGNVTSIPQSLFSENNALWLGVTVGVTPELTPRQQLATVAFAANSETLQGLLPITATSAGTTNVVLALNSSGNLVIGGSATPTFQATGGQFTVSGQAVLITTNAGTNSNVILQPDGLGKIELNKPIVNNTLNNNIATAIGSVEIDDLFSILATSSGQSAFTLNQNGAGPLISASASGVARFTVDNAGNIFAAGDLQINGGDITSGNTAITIDSGSANSVSLGASDAFNISGNFSQTGSTTFSTGTGLVSINGNINTDLIPNSTSSDLGSLTNFWGAIYANNIYPATSSIVQGFLQRNSGALSPTYITDDFLFGGSSTSSALFRITGGNKFTGTSPVASIAGNTSFAALVVDNKGSGDLIVASSSAFGTNPQRTQFQVTGTGALYTRAFYDLDNSTYYLDPAAAGLSLRTAGSASISSNLTFANGAASIQSTARNTLTLGGNTTGQVILSGFGGAVNGITFSGYTSCTLKTDTSGIVTCGTDNAGGGTNWWNQLAGVLSPVDTGYDFALGGNSTSSAKFSFTGIKTGNTIASVSGNLIVMPNNGWGGQVGIGTTTPSSLLHVFSGTSGSANSAADDLVIEGSGATGMTITAPSNQEAGIYFGRGNLDARSATITRPANVDALVFSVSNKVERMRIDDTGKIGLGTTTPISELHVTRPLSFGVTGKALAIFDQIENQDIFTASASGTPIFTVTRAGGIALGTNGLSYGTSTQCLVGGTTASWASCSSASSNYWQRALGSLTPINITDSINLGSTATSSALVHLAGTAGENSFINTGNVGIGTTAPSYPLDVTGDVRFTGGLGIGTSVPGLDGRLVLSQDIVLEGNPNSGAYLTANGSPTVNNTGFSYAPTISANATYARSLLAAETIATGVTVTNRYGVYIENPALSGTGAITNNYGIYLSDQTAGGTDYAIYSAGGQSYFAGNVGIGTTNPQVKLTVGDSATSAQNTIRIYGDVAADKAPVLSLFRTASRESVIAQTLSGLVFANTGGLGNYNDSTINAASNLIITSAGNVGIGTTSPIAPLHVTGAYGSNAALIINQLNSGDLLTASASGDTKFIISNIGDITVKAGIAIKPTVDSTSAINFGTSGGSWFATFDTTNRRFGIGTITPLVNLDVRGNSGTLSVASVSGRTSFASLVVNNDGVGDLITASASGWTRFKIANSGSITSSAYTTGGGIIYATSNGLFSQTTAGSSNECLKSTGGGTPTWGTCGSGGGDSFWGQTNGLLYPANSTVDLAIGGTSSTSAKFLFANVNSGTPTLKIFDSTKTFSLNLSHDGTNGNILSTTGTVNIGQGGGTLYIQTDIQNDSSNNLGAIRISDRVNILASDNVNTNAALIVNNTGSGDILTASGAGITRFVIQNGGNVGIGTNNPGFPLEVTGTVNITSTNFLRLGDGKLLVNHDGTNAIIDTNASGGDIVVRPITALRPYTSNTYDLGTSSFIWRNLYVGNVLGASSTGIQGYWQRNGGALSPTNITDDILFGSSATTSAKIAFTGLYGNQAQGSISGQLIVMPNNGWSGRVGIGTTLPLARLDIKNENSTAVQGSEKITNSNDNGFTTDTGNWTDPGGWTIVGGKANKDTAGTGALTLSNSALDSAPVAGTIYRIDLDYTTSSTSSGSITVSFGGGSSGSIADVPGNSGTTVTVVVTASNTNALTITPTSNWIGTIDNVFVYPLTPNTAALRIEASNGTSIPVEIRPGRSGNSNIFVGYQSGYVNTNGSSNNAFGAGALASNIEGSNNNAFGVNALNETTTGWGNSAFGDYTMRSNTVGILNAAFGYEALWNSVDGNYNSAFGQQALGNNDGGDGNASFGYNSLLNTDGNYNSSLGYQAGYTNILGSKNTFLGYLSDSNVGHLYNSSAIGANSYVTQNDSLILGSINGINSATASARIGIGTTAPYVTFDVRGGSGTLAVGSFSGTTSFAALVANNDGVGDLFTASKSGRSIFTVRNNGQLTLGAPYYTAGCTALETNSAGTLVCGTDDGGTNWWNQLGGVLSPVDTGYDFALGGNSTSSAKFSFTGIKSGQTIASISGQLVIAPNNGYGGNIIPAIDNKQSIGSSPSARWKDLFLGPTSLHIQCRTTDAGCPATQDLDYSLGINSAGTFALGANVGGVNPASLFVTQGGNVGIGTSVPGTLTTIKSASSLTSSTVANALEITASGPAADNQGALLGIIFNHNSGGQATELSRQAAIYSVSEATFSNSVGLAFSTFNSSLSEKLRITSTGNVGIGTTSPDGLQVNLAVNETARGVDNVRLGTLGGSPRIIFEDNGSIQHQIDNTAGVLRFYRPSNISMRINESGRVQIDNGTGAFTGQFNVAGNSGTNNALVVLNQSGTGDIIAASLSGATKFRVANSGSIYGASFVDIDNTSYFLDPAATGNALIINGSAGIGTTTPTQKLEIVGTGTMGASVSATQNPFLTVRRTNAVGQLELAVADAPGNWFTTGVVAGDSIIRYQNNAGTGLKIGNNPSGSPYVTIDNSGNVGIGTTAPGAILHIGAAGTITNPTLRGFYGSIANSRDEWLRINDDDAGTPDYHTSGIYLDGPYIGTQSCIEVGGGDATCNFVGGVNTVGGLGVDNLTVIDAAGQFLYSNLSGAIDKFGKLNASGFGIDSNNNTTYDLLVYDGGDIYTNRAFFGYGGVAAITTYDTNENLSIDPNGTGSVDITGALNVTGGVTLGTSLNSTSDHFSLHDAKTDDTTYEWIGFYSGATRQGIILYDGAWTGCMNTATDFCLVAENSNRLVLQSGTAEVYVNDALTVVSTLTGALNCTGCIDQTDVAASAIGQGELKTSTGVATAGSGVGVDITGQVYQFTPSWTDTNTREHCVSSWTSNADPGNQTSRWRAASTDCTGVATNGTHTSRWRYITASDHPTLWMIANADGTLTQTGWEAEDPVDPTKWPENPNPIEGSDLKSGQYFVSPEFPSVTEMKKLYAQLPQADQDEILKGLKDYIVNQRNWLTELNSLDDLENINERYYHSGRQWAFRYLSSHYKLAVPISISIFTKLVDGKLIAVDNATIALQAYQDAQIALQQEEEAIPAYAKKADIAEWYKSDGTSLEQGDVLEIGDHGLIGRATKDQSNKIVGIISSYPGQLLGMPTSETDIKIALSGRVPTKVSSENGPIKAGDALTISSIPGVAAKAIVAGDVVGKALEDYDNTDPEAVGKIMVFVNVSWYDPDVYLANTDNFTIDLATTSAELNIPSYYTISDVLGTPTKRAGAFAEAAIANLRVGGVSASEILTSALNVTSENITINGDNIRDYISRILNDILNNSNSNLIAPIASVDQVHTNLISPVSPTSKVAVKLDDDRVSILNGNSSTSATVTSFDNKGNATLSGSLAVGKDATVGGTLRASRIIADQIEGLNIVSSTVSANYITNNYYSSSNSAFPTLVASPSNISSASSNLFSGLFSSNNFINIATYSSELGYVENLSGSNAAFSQSLTVFGSTILSDTSVVGQLAINGGLILSNNSINVLGSDLNLQPLRQGGLSIMAGLFYIDTNGNVTTEGDATIKGTLYANAISPIPGSDLAINLGTSSALTNPSLRINNSSGSAVLAIDQKGDLVSSGSGTFGKLNIGGLIAPALAVSPTEVIATGSAGTGVINTGRTQMTINNKLVTEDSLIYITPTSTTTQTIFLLRQEPDKSFTVGIQNPTLTPIKFNWIIVN